MTENQIKPEQTNNYPTWKRERERVENEGASWVCRDSKDTTTPRTQIVVILFSVKEHFTATLFNCDLNSIFIFIICLFSSYDDDSKLIEHDSKWWKVQVVNGIGHVSCSALRFFFTQQKNGDIRNELLNCDEKRCNYYPWSIAMAIYISAV